VGQEPWEELSGQISYGDEAFGRRVARPIPSPEVPHGQRQPVRPRLGELVREKTAAAIGQAYWAYGYRLAEIAQQLGVHSATVSRRLRHFEKRTPEELSKMYECKT